MIKRNLLCLAAVAAITSLDQVVKHWMLANLKPVGTMPFIPGFLRLIYHENRGAAFGLLQNARWFFVVITILALAAVVYVFARNLIPHPFGVAAITMATGGAIGNFIDRAARGYVVDFFEFEFVNFAVFNVADFFLVTGGIMACVYFAFIYQKNAEQKPEAGEAAGEDNAV